jgi:hypothetical protein
VITVSILLSDTWLGSTVLFQNVKLQNDHDFQQKLRNVSCI